MKTMLLAAAAALSLGAASAYAGEGTIANTRFASIPGVVAQAHAQVVPAVAIAQNRPAVRVYVTQSSRGTWLFPPNQNGNG